MKIEKQLHQHAGLQLGVTLPPKMPSLRKHSRVKTSVSRPRILSIASTASTVRPWY